MTRKQQRVLQLVSGAVLSATIATPALSLDRVPAKDGSGTYGYTDTPIQPWSGYHVHDPDRPLPPRVNVGPAPTHTAAPPSDAVVLFNGTDLSKWRPTQWKLVDGCVETTEGDLTSLDSFGDCQIHLEWLAPANFQGPWSNQGNNGVYLLGLHEIQIFDSWNEKIYPDGMAGSIYGQTPPLVNACRPPGEWQTFDMVFVAPVFEAGKLKSPGRVTLMHNGVLVLHDEAIHGETAHRGLPAYTQKISQGPIMLSGHHCPVRFRNIWVRPLKRTSGTVRPTTQASP